MAWCEANCVEYVFGLAGNAVLHRLAYDIGDDLTAFAPRRRLPFGAVSGQRRMLPSAIALKRSTA